MLCDNESTVAGLEPAMSCRWPRQPASHQKQKHKKNLLWSPIPIQMIWLLKLEKLVRDAQVSDCKQLCCFDWFIWYLSSTSSIWVSWHDSFGVTKLCDVFGVASDTLCWSCLWSSSIFTLARLKWTVLPCVSGPDAADASVAASTASSAMYLGYCCCKLLIVIIVSQYKSIFPLQSMINMDLCSRWYWCHPHTLIMHQMNGTKELTLLTSLVFALMQNLCVKQYKLPLGRMYFVCTPSLLHKLKLHQLASQDVVLKFWCKH